MWVKKHAPTRFDDIVGNAQIVARFHGMAKSRYMQHMILCGPSGVGKSLLVDLIIREMLGPYAAEGTLVFRSADDKGNTAVREKIHQFVPKKIHVKTPKFVVFKQADQLSDGVQQIMRRLMEQHYHHAIFIFICKDLHGILQTIQSRCHIFQFHPVSVPDQVRRLRTVAEAEGVATADDTDAPYERIAQMAHGDMRACLNYFQAACCALGDGSPLDLHTIETVCLFPHYDQVAGCVRLLLGADHASGDGPSPLTRFHQCVGVVHSLHQQGYCGLDIVMFFHTYLMTAQDALPRSVVLAWLKDIAVVHHRLSKGVDSAVQLYGMLAVMFRHALTGTSHLESS